MRIAQLLEALDVGGMERLAVDLGIAHHGAGHTSSIYTLFDAGPLAPEAISSGVAVEAFHKKLGFSFATVLELARRLRRDRIDVLHTHNSVVHHYGTLAASLARVGIVNTRHGVSLIHTRAIQEAYFRATIPLTQQFVFVSEDTRRFFEGRGVPRSKSNVVLNGIPLQKWTAVRAAPGVRAPRLRCISVGRLVAVKAVDVLIDAVALAVRSNPHITLHIVGDGPLRSALVEKTHSLELDAHITFDGAIADPQRLLAGADLFVMSSLSEGLPIALLEAMASGLPVIATRVGGIPEVVTPAAGWLCDANRADTLAALLLEAANSTRLAAIGRAGQELVLRTFGIDRVQAQYGAIFERARGARRRAD